ncbi:ParB N-terminal domain-containing protein [Rhizobium sp. VS19-DR104.2]|uniref:ParB/RepB/Spo0J family partition protein n=1 Tax=Rhizobium/Agrobacterium group TaxID=227290 RepID=UPI001CC5F809|nr:MULTISPECIES: ParB/RepB/Spo0J family partition protein [unclassified Rhizobium]MBZ5763816.1 ParB N-terminal domain-containing protein [Rhizobium sp. VS19-DR96]MBZ5769743.1 ParB N-terminal domain-containing protein [Rhizobium sp. VS19-DR129.2]MBZ5777285.1 ParB N-terminal domain-containing protein [Rhizobium sp. VS19-DRK62.2]MBZ5788402.1 ParB N-terminal domain-containing protein [Rhizobium sp. VS19-DR121]MBZ5805865.1 ParB N-terminal domain-containing protein [Rhizobium sp. VS19-DR181]
MSNTHFMETHVPFNQLTLSHKNVRRTGRDTPEYKAGIEALAASILTQGLLQNLIVHPVADGVFGVAGGGRRYDAIDLLVTTGKIDPDWPVRVIVVDEDDTTAASLAENFKRVALSPADEYDAFAGLTGEGWSIDRIADAFGVTPLVVERRLKLAAAAPELVEQFREGLLTTEQMIALCATDDHALQLSVWERLGSAWNNSPAELRRAVLAQEVDASTDNRVAFIGGVAAFEAAGGVVRRDLFTDDENGGFITDVALLEKLVADKLEAEAETLRAEGWGWVEVWPSFDYTNFQRLGQAPEVLGEVSAEDRAKLDELQAELAKVNAEVEALHARTDEYTDEENERLGELYDLQDEIPEQIGEIEAKHMVTPVEVRQLSGALVIREAGRLRIERGMVKAADRKAIAAAMGEGQAIQGGRESEPAGRKSDTVSDALRRSLLGHRNLAVQMVVSQRPDAAKLLLACWVVKEIRRQDSHGYTPRTVPTDLAISSGYGTRTHHPIADEAGKAKADAFAAACKEAIKGLPTADGKLWDALAAMEPAQLDGLIAYGVALSVSVDSNHATLTGKLLETLQFDMADHFEATADNYLGKVSKGLIVAALDEAKQIKGSTDRAALLAQKKGKLAAEAETRLAGSGWVPKGIRTPKPKAAPAPKKPAASKAKAKGTTTVAKPKSRKAKAESAAVLAA